MALWALRVNLNFVRFPLRCFLLPHKKLIQINLDKLPNWVIPEIRVWSHFWVLRHFWEFRRRWSKPRVFLLLPIKNPVSLCFSAFNYKKTVKRSRNVISRFVCMDTDGLLTFKIDEQENVCREENQVAKQDFHTGGWIQFPCETNSQCWLFWSWG